MGMRGNFAGGHRTVEVVFGSDFDQMKAAVNALRWGRNPFHLRPALKGTITKLLRNGLARALREWSTGRGMRSSMDDVLKEIGEKVVETFKKQLKAMDYDRAAKPLTEKYARWKQRKVGFIHPMLVLTGSLVNGITYRLR